MGRKRREADDIRKHCGSSVIRFVIGTHLNYRGRLHVVVAVTPVGVRPMLIDLEDVESGRVRRVKPDDPEIDPSVERAEMRQDSDESDPP
jgi:hypothetical protein